MKYATLQSNAMLWALWETELERRPYTFLGTYFIGRQLPISGQSSGRG